MKHPDIVSKFLIAGLLLLPAVAGADEQGREAKSARAFVQDFYTWYGQEGKQDHGMALSDFALKTKPQLFSAKIIAGLKEDEAAQAKVPDEVVGLDFDPIVAAQDDCSPYKTGKATMVGVTYRVEIYGESCDPKPAKPQVVAVVEKQKGSWVFVDFIYPDSGDLFSELQALKKEREQPGG